MAMTHWSRKIDSSALRTSGQEARAAKAFTAAVNAWMMASRHSIGGSSASRRLEARVVRRGGRWSQVRLLFLTGSCERRGQRLVARVRSPHYPLRQVVKRSRGRLALKPKSRTRNALPRCGRTCSQSVEGKEKKLSALPPRACCGSWHLPLPCIQLLPQRSCARSWLSSSARPLRTLE